MLQAFYKQNPVRDTPYRELDLSSSDNGWEVRLFGGTHWGRTGRNVLKIIPVMDFEQGKTVFDQVYRELCDEGWKAYSPYQPWD